MLGQVHRMSEQMGPYCGLLALHIFLEPYMGVSAALGLAGTGLGNGRTTLVDVERSQIKLADALQVRRPHRSLSTMVSNLHALPCSTCQVVSKGHLESSLVHMVEETVRCQVSGSAVPAPSTAMLLESIVQSLASALVPLVSTMLALQAIKPGVVQGIAAETEDPVLQADVAALLQLASASQGVPTSLPLASCEQGWLFRQGYEGPEIYGVPMARRRLALVCACLLDAIAPAAIEDPAARLLSPRAVELLRVLQGCKAEKESGPDQRRTFVFSQLRVECEVLRRLAGTCPSLQGLAVGKLVTMNGSSAALSMTAAEGQRTLQDFRLGKLDVLVATSVAEEGLDIPSCNRVVCTVPPSNPKSFIQLRGRARAKGSVLEVLLADDDNKGETAVHGFLEEEQAMLDGARARDNGDLYQLELESIFEPWEGLGGDNGGDMDDPEVLHLARKYRLVSEETGAILDLREAVGRLFEYCAALPRDAYHQPSPVFVMERDPSGSRYCRVLMPAGAPFPSLEGDRVKSKRLARHLAAFRACERLVAEGALSDRFKPLKTLRTPGAPAKTKKKGEGRAEETVVQGVRWQARVPGRLGRHVWDGAADTSASFISSQGNVLELSRPPLPSSLGMVPDSAGEHHLLRFQMPGGESVLLVCAAPLAQDNDLALVLRAAYGITLTATRAVELTPDQLQLLRAAHRHAFSALERSSRYSKVPFDREGWMVALNPTTGEDAIGTSLLETAAQAVAGLSVKHPGTLVRSLHRGILYISDGQDAAVTLDSPFPDQTKAETYRQYLGAIAGAGKQLEAS